MALQIRRGSEAQRQSLSGASTPAIGEPLYTVDTKKLFIGDGTTVGGVALGYYGAVNVAGQPSLSASNNTDTLTFIAGDNIVLTTNEANDSITISAPRDVEVFNTGSINIFQNNIIGLNSNENIVIKASGTGVIDVQSSLTISGTITGNLTGNVTGNVSGTASTVTASSQPNITSLGTLTGLNVDGVISATTMEGNFVGQLKGSVFADDSALLVDGINAAFYGTHYGDLITDTISIVDNTISTLESNQNIIVAPSGTGLLNVQSTVVATRLELFNDIFGAGISIPSASPTNAPFIINTTHNSPSTSSAFSTIEPERFDGPQIGATVTFLRAKGVNPIDPQTVVNNDEIATLDFNGFFRDDGAFYTAAKIKGVVDGTVSSNVVPGRLEFLATNSIGTSATRLTVSGSEVAATVPFKLPIVADDAARTALVPIPSQGMMIFMQSGASPAATNQAQVYDGTNWVNL